MAAALALAMLRPCLAQENSESGALVGAAAASKDTTGDELEALATRIVAGPAFGDIAGYVFRASPMIRAARAEWKSALEKIRVATGHENPELMAEGMYMNEDINDTINPDDWKITLTQAFPWPGKLGKEGKVADAEARIARIRLDQTVRDVMVLARESCAELAYTQAARRIAAANNDLLAHVGKVGEAGYAQGRAGLIDVMKAQAQTGQVQYDILLLVELEVTEKARLNGLMNRQPEAAIGPLVLDPSRPVVYSVEEIQALMEAGLEELGIARTGVEKAQAMADLAWYENLPGFKLGAIYQNQGFDYVYGLQVGITLPVWYDKNAGRLAAARAEVEKASAMAANQTAESRTAVREVFFRIKNAERLIKLYGEDLLPQAAKAVDTAETWYRQGQGSLTDYLQAQSAQYNFQLALARASADHAKFLARLEKLAGRVLTHRDGEGQL